MAEPYVSPDPGDENQYESQDFIKTRAPDAVDDPESEMEEIFGPAGKNTFAEPGKDPAPPPEIEEVFEEYGLQKYNYSCTLKKAKGSNVIIKNFKACYPSVEWITQNCGPGEYNLVFFWKGTVDEGKRRRKTNETIRITVEDTLENRRVYRSYQLERNLEDFKRNRDKVRDAVLEKSLESQLTDLGLDPEGLKKDEKVDPIEIARQQIEQSRQLAALMIPAQKPSVDWEKIVPLLAAVIPPVLKHMSESRMQAQNQFQLMLTTLINSQNNSSAQMLEMMRDRQPTSGQETMKEVFEMIRSVVDFKKIMEPEKETLADKVFNLVESIAPHIAGVLAAPKAQQATDPRVVIGQQYAKTSPEIQALMQDKNQMIEFVNRMDQFYGWEQTDGILEVMTGGQLQRPDECPRREVLRYPGGPESAENQQAARNLASEEKPQEATATPAE